MLPARVVVTSLVAIGAAACFDPTFHNPVCGGDNECPEGWTCAGGTGKPCVLDDNVPDPPPPDATPPGPGEPDAMPQPCTKTWVSVLKNGGFDAGDVDWNEDPANIPVIYKRGEGLPVTPDSGDYSALLGGHDFRVQKFTQPVTLPAGTERVRFKGSRCLATTEMPDMAYDRFKISLVKASDDTTAVATFFEWDNRNGFATCAWKREEKVVDVVDPVAQTVFRVYSELDGATVSTLYLDTLELEAFACPPPPPVSAEVPER